MILKTNYYEGEQNSSVGLFFFKRIGISHNNIFISIMLKKKNFGNKDKLLEVLKNPKLQAVISNLDGESILNLSLASKKYYLALAPVLAEFSMTTGSPKTQKKVEVAQKKSEKSNKKNMQSKKPFMDVDVHRQPFWKVKKFFKQQNWKRLKELPFQNDYLQKKLTNKIAFFYQNENTKEIIYINRSLVDPELTYNYGGFDDEQITEFSEKLYGELVGEQLNDIDFSSPEALRNRQKEVLLRIQKRKDQIKKLQEINYEEELFKAIHCKKIAVILCFGGSFSFGIFQDGKCKMHKSDKKYVCRKKAGERQLNRDKCSGSQIYSMGSQIRRDQQKKHQINVENILTQYKRDIEECDYVFLQAPGLNRLVVINADQTLNGCKEKLRSVCLTAKKANFTEVESIFSEISKICFVKEKEK